MFWSYVSLAGMQNVRDEKKNASYWKFSMYIVNHVTHNVYFAQDKSRDFPEE